MKKEKVICDNDIDIDMAFILLESHGVIKEIWTYLSVKEIVNIMKTNKKYQNI